MRFHRVFVLGFVFINLNTPVLGQMGCGMDDCPLGFQNLFCRKFTKVTKTWHKEPLRGISFDHQMCVVNSGGPISVGGDLTYYMNVKNVPSGQSLLVTAKCQVTLNDPFSGSGPISYDNGGGATFGPFTSKPSKRAESYIMAAQLPPAQRQAFRTLFVTGVDIDCALTFEAEQSKSPQSPPSVDLDVSCTPSPCPGAR
jgi:hypothetical protein